MAGDNFYSPRDIRFVSSQIHPEKGFKMFIMQFCQYITASAASKCIFNVIIDIVMRLLFCIVIFLMAHPLVNLIPDITTYDFVLY